MVIERHEIIGTDELETREAALTIAWFGFYRFTIRNPILLSSGLLTANHRCTGGKGDEMASDVFHGYCACGTNGV